MIGEPKGTAPWRVLIVEDEARLRDMLLRAIREMDFTVTGARSGEAALRALEESAADIIVVDLNLPGMNGLALCEQVRTRWPTTQTIVLTGYGDLEAAQRAIRLDVADFLTKPCPLADLEAALDRALRRRRHHIMPWEVPAPERAGVVPGEPDGTGAEETPATAETLEEMERRHILDALGRHDGNRAATAEELGISLRTLYYRLHAYEKQGYYRRD